MGCAGPVLYLPRAGKTGLDRSRLGSGAGSSHPLQAALGGVL